MFAPFMLLVLLGLSEASQILYCKTTYMLTINGTVVGSTNIKETPTNKIVMAYQGTTVTIKSASDNYYVCMYSGGTVYGRLGSLAADCEFTEHIDQKKHGYKSYSSKHHKAPTGNRMYLAINRRGKVLNGQKALPPAPSTKWLILSGIENDTIASEDIPFTVVGKT
ncbi:unknown [Singapore grouper iridovirus]|uniref:Fibroblast growth factor n=1 Tax=Singapore grouper iridovirus TaxID=262968 RepID=Q5YFC0_9VIRU|nr:hypothetical protein ORF145R [Singapore grouper iridovirus]AAS18160.1 unknown [Singapore grouper iridovirus]WAU86854.1 hypothetical protein ORF145R [Singapore grouper iridovirus]